MSTYLKIDKSEQMARAKRRNTIRGQRMQYFMVYSLPFFRGKQGYIGRPFRLAPKRGMQVIEEQDEARETVKLIAMQPMQRSVYAPHQGVGEMARRAARRDVTGILSKVGILGKLRGERPIVQSV